MDTFVVPTPEGAIHGWRYDGDGPPAVLLHGGPCMSASYLEPLVPHLAGVFQLILYQQRESRRRPSTGRTPSRRTSPTPPP